MSFEVLYRSKTIVFMVFDLKNCAVHSPFSISRRFCSEWMNFANGTARIAIWSSESAVNCFLLTETSWRVSVRFLRWVSLATPPVPLLVCYRLTSYTLVARGRRPDVRFRRPFLVESSRFWTSCLDVVRTSLEHQYKHLFMEFLTAPRLMHLVLRNRCVSNFVCLPGCTGTIGSTQHWVICCCE